MFTSPLYKFSRGSCGEKVLYGLDLHSISTELSPCAAYSVMSQTRRLNIQPILGPGTPISLNCSELKGIFRSTP